jgi:hypothetical protein
MVNMVVLLKWETLPQFPILPSSSLNQAVVPSSPSFPGHCITWGSRSFRSSLLIILNAVPMYHEVFKTFRLHDSNTARFAYLQQNKDKLLLAQKDLKGSLKKRGLQEHGLDV